MRQSHGVKERFHIVKNNTRKNQPTFTNIAEICGEYLKILLIKRGFCDILNDREQIEGG